MSHTVQIKTEFKNLTSLKNAFEKLGWKIRENKALRTYQGTGPVYALMAENPDRNRYNAYDIGITEKAETIDLATDFYGGSVESSLGHDLGKLKQEYAADVLQSELSGLGFMVSTVKDDQGNIIMEGEQA